MAPRIPRPTRCSTTSAFQLSASALPLALALLALVAGAAGAQPVAPGSTVRAYLEDGLNPVQGTLISTNSDSFTLSLEDGATNTVSRDELLRLDVRQSKRHTLLGGGIGLGVGLILGIAVKAADTDDCEGFPDEFCDAVIDSGTAPAVFWLPVVGTALGAGIGALIKTERWVPVIEAGPAGTVGIGVRTSR